MVYTSYLGTRKGQFLTRYNQFPKSMKRLNCELELLDKLAKFSNNTKEYYY